MVQATLKDRVADLEKTVAGLIDELQPSGVKKDWRAAVGYFKHDVFAKAIDEEGRKIRQIDRQQN